MASLDYLLQPHHAYINTLCTHGFVVVVSLAHVSELFYSCKYECTNVVVVAISFVNSFHFICSFVSLCIHLGHPPTIHWAATPSMDQLFQRPNDWPTVVGQITTCIFGFAAFNTVFGVFFLAFKSVLLLLHV